MALLPLSGLWRLGELSRIDVKSAEIAVRKSADHLNPGYFRVLKEKEFTAVLETVWQKPQSLFPFSYR
jgi:hypothetical protein